MAVKSLVALTLAEVRLFLRDPFSTVFALFFPLTMMLLLAAVFGNDPEEAQAVENGMLVWRGVTPTDYYAAGSVGIIAVAFGVMSLPIQLVGYRERGVLRRMRASSVSAWTIFAAQFILGILIMLCGTVIMTLAAVLILDASAPEDILGVAVAALVGMAALSALGALLTGVMPTSRAAQGIGLLIFFTCWLLAGTGPPLAVLPEGVRTLSDILPLTYLVVAIQDPWFGFGWSWSDLGILAGIAVVAGTLAIWRFRWD